MFRLSLFIVWLVWRPLSTESNGKRGGQIVALTLSLAFAVTRLVDRVGESPFLSLCVSHCSVVCWLHWSAAHMQRCAAQNTRDVLVGRNQKS